MSKTITKIRIWILKDDIKRFKRAIADADGSIEKHSNSKNLIMRFWVKINIWDRKGSARQLEKCRKNLERLQQTL